MRYLAILSGLLIAAVPITALGQQRTPAEAEQHARDENENACAQRKPECWTPTPRPTNTPQPTVTPTPVPVQLPQIPTPEPEPEATPEPCWQTYDDGSIMYREDGTPVSCEDWATAQVPIDDEVAENTAPYPTPVPLVPAGNRPPAPTAQTAPPPQVVYVYVDKPSTSERVEAPTPIPARSTSTPRATPTMLETRTPLPTATPTVARTATPARVSRETPTPSPVPTRAPARQLRRPLDGFELPRIPWPAGPDVPPASPESWWEAVLPTRAMSFDTDVDDTPDGLPHVGLETD